MSQRELWKMPQHRQHESWNMSQHESCHVQERTNWNTARVRGPCCTKHVYVPNTDASNLHSYPHPHNLTLTQLSDPRPVTPARPIDLRAPAPEHNNPPAHAHAPYPLPRPSPQPHNAPPHLHHTTTHDAPEPHHYLETANPLVNPPPPPPYIEPPQACVTTTVSLESACGHLHRTS